MNPQPPVLETGALPIELHSYYWYLNFSLLFIRLFRFFKDHMFANDRVIFFILYTTRMQTPAFHDRITISSTSSAFNLDNVSLTVTRHSLLNNLRYNTGTHSPSAFTNSKAQFLIHGYRCNQFHIHHYIITRHDHLCSRR